MAHVNQLSWLNSHRSWKVLTLNFQFKLPSCNLLVILDTLNFDLASSGFLSALPYVAMSVLVFVSSFLADWFQVNGYLTTTQVRRYFNCYSFIGQAVFMLLAAFLLDPTYSVVLLTIAVGVGAFSLSGFTVNHLDIAPKFASILMGISNTFGTIPGIMSPLLTGFIVTTPVSQFLLKTWSFNTIALNCFRPNRNGKLFFTSLLQFIFSVASFIGFSCQASFSLGPLARKNISWKLKCKN